MTLIELGGARRRDDVTTSRGAPFPIPTSPPYNAPTFMTATPTPDGTGSMVHPSVIDFGSGKKWRGFRYWMAMTPYWQSINELENPSILVSNDAYNWQVPVGLTNPVYPSPPGHRFGSDPDLEYDPRSDELVLIYREQEYDGSQNTFYARSPNGVTWPAVATRLDWVRPGGASNGQVLSPCIVRKAEGEWYLWGIWKEPADLLRYSASSPEGPWTGPETCTGFPVGGWHLDIMWDSIAGLYRCILDHNAGSLGDGLSAGTSLNGKDWVWSPTRILVPTYEWEGAAVYRPTITRHENGTHYRLWYSCDAGLGTAISWRCGYTELPMSLWPTLP